MKVGLAGALLAAGMLMGSAAPAAHAGGLATAARPAAGDVIGRVTYVVDGDTIHVRVGSRTEKVRVIGVDAPELKTRECFSTQAKAATTGLVAGKVVTLRADRTQTDRDAYRRLLRHVILSDKSSLGLRLISNGFGREFTFARPYVGQPTFRTAQARAVKANRGVWSAGCARTAARPKPATKPAAKQPAAKKPASKLSPKPGTCSVKGNISSRGERIYHVRGQRYYDATKISVSRGERWFCSPRDAQRAGWRAAKI